MRWPSMVVRATPGPGCPINAWAARCARLLPSSIVSVCWDAGFGVAAMLEMDAVARRRAAMVAFISVRFRQGFVGGVDHEHDEHRGRLGPARVFADDVVLPGA